MISVVMAVYNASKYIARAIESILHQTFQEFEFIIVDDGSTDDTLEIAKRYSERDNRMRVIKSDHRGISYARNIGIKESKYPWIAIMDADDIALPDRLEKQINAAKGNPKVVVWGTYTYYINSKEKIIGFYKFGPTSEKEFYEQRKKGMIVGVHGATALLKKDIVLKAGGYDPQIQAASDFELFDRMANHGLIISVPEPLLLYRINLQSHTMQHFFLTRWVWTYLTTRREAQLTGKAEPSFEEITKKLKQRTFLVKARSYLGFLGQFLYRKGGMYLGEGRYLQGSLYSILAVLFNPQYFFRKIYEQRFSSEARKWLKK